MFDEVRRMEFRGRTYAQCYTFHNCSASKGSIAMMFAHLQKTCSSSLNTNNFLSEFSRNRDTEQMWGSPDWEIIWNCRRINLLLSRCIHQSVRLGRSWMVRNGRDGDLKSIDQLSSHSWKCLHAHILSLFTHFNFKYPFSAICPSDV